MMLILRHGKKNNSDSLETQVSVLMTPHTNTTGGYILLDALLSIFISGIIILIICGATSLHRRISTGSLQNTGTIINERNQFEHKRMQQDE